MQDKRWRGDQCSFVSSSSEQCLQEHVEGIILFCLIRQLSDTISVLCFLIPTNPLSAQIFEVGGFLCLR